MVPELHVTDFEKSLDFYTRILGFKVINRRYNPDFAYLDLDTVQLMIEHNPQSSWMTGALEKPFGRGINFQIEVEDVNSFYKSIKNENIEVFKTLKESWYKTGDNEESGQEEFLVLDPDGYLLRFMQHLGERNIS
jgi:catechol 2,3-dioxygenase-like lactoylglutathione lyase family enzyme